MLCCVVLYYLCCVVFWCVVLCCVLCCAVVRWVDWVVCCVVVLDLVMWGACFVVMCAVERRGDEIARREPQDLSVTVELGLCHCSRLPGKVDYQTE
jgi:hypothetical protein